MAVLALAATLAAPAGAEDAPARIRLLTGPEGGTYHALGTLLAGRAPEGTKLESVTSDGSLGNLIMTSLGKADFGMTQADALAFMRAQPEYERPMSRIQAVLPLHREELHIVVRRGAGIAAPADLGGKRFNIGIGASGSSVSGAVLLDALGLGEDTVEISQLGNGEALAALKAGEIDAMLVTGGAPLAFLGRLPAADEKAIALLPIDAATAKKLTAGLPYWEARIAARTYPWQPGEVATVATRCLLVTSAAAPAETVALFARTVLAASGELAKGHAKWGEVDRDLARRLVAEGALPFHEGAKRAIQE